MIAFVRKNLSGLVVALITASQVASAGTIGVVRELTGLSPRGISGSGQVVGLSTATWNPIVMDGKTGRITTINDQRYYVAISSNGLITSQSQQQAKLRQPDGSFQLLGYIGSGYYSDHSEPLGVNDRGTVVGYSKASLRDNHAFASVPGASNEIPRKMVDLGTLGGKNSAATAVNNGGTVVGQADNGQWGAHAFRSGSSYENTPVWSSSSNRASSAVQDLGTLGGKNSTALAVNDSGVIVGASNIHDGQSPFTSFTTFGSNEAVHAFAHGLDGQYGMTDLGTLLGFKNSIATGINAQGQIVGYATDAQVDLYHYYNTSLSYGNAHAFLYDQGKMTDLNDLLPMNSGWLLKTAVDINDLGQIVGTGSYNGEDRGYLFELGSTSIQPSPVPEPTTLAFFGVIAAGVMARRRQRA